MRRHTWTVGVLSAGFFFLFMAFNTAQSLESTIVEDNQLVNTSLALLYGVFTITAIAAPRIVQLLGPRLAMALGSIPYVLLVFANIYPSWGLFMPAFFGVGVGAACLWTAQGIALSRLAIAEANVTRESPEIVTSRFNGLFWTVFQFNGAVGLTIASTVLNLVSHDAIKYMFIGFGAVGACGTVLLSLLRMPPHHDTVPAAVEDSSATGGDFIDTAPLVVPVDGDEAYKSGRGKEVKTVSIYDTVRLIIASPSMRLLVPIIFYNGASLGYNGAMFPLAYTSNPNSDSPLVTKANVGYIAAIFFLANSLSSWLWGTIIPRIGRRPLFVLTLITHIVFYSVLLAVLNGGIPTRLNEHDNGPAAFVFVATLAVIFALGDSVLESQIPAIIQSPTFFPDERDRDAANANVRLWQSLGFTAQFVVGIILPRNVSVQTYIVFPLMLVALLCLFILDRWVQPLDTPAKGTYTPIMPKADAVDAE